ncbi:GntR family transcriptional regulator [Clostridium sp. 'White wine YQ']|uniref:GntR family transcriptional regulator n=1 Tax=Clostridium sp. 'White wine YQ' TaxID=3027474 RepID=UPI0023670C0E|nr:GntR family transcriptional regulator [Clostridium sp. 'White wine YQ']MDD7794699.1 GntR family transcriptional regulator [Clostridium sp. 'White wine YQ']
MNINIDYSSDLPMYEQIEICIKENILLGKIKFNEALPSVRQLSKELNISTITTKRAYMDLEREGYIYTVSGKGTFVNSIDTTKLLKEKREKLLEEYKMKVLEIKEAGVSKEDIIKIIEELYRG